jgi:hypothetical protein
MHAMEHVIHLEFDARFTVRDFTMMKLLFYQSIAALVLFELLRTKTLLPASIHEAE